MLFEIVGQFWPIISKVKSSYESMKTLLAEYYVKTFGDIFTTFIILLVRQKVSWETCKRFKNNSIEIAASDMEAWQNMHVINSSLYIISTLTCIITAVQTNINFLHKPCLELCWMVFLWMVYILEVASYVHEIPFAVLYV